MECQVCNCTTRPVTIHCNSGDSHHLPPGYKFELPEQEVLQNASIKRLQDRKIISIVKLETKPASKDVSKEKKQEAVKEKPDKDSDKSTKKKTRTKN